MKIKVCGMKNPNNIRQVAALKPDYMGFICYDLSSRFIAELPKNVVHELPSGLQKTAVFVNETAEKINNLIDEFGFEVVQLHGNESPDFCQALRSRVTVFKAFGIDQNFDFSLLDVYAQSVDYFMFDTKTDIHGGSGQVFDWQLINQYHLQVPFFICGGLSPENIGKVNQIKHPAFYGVDLNSRFEVEPGIKNVEKLREAFALLRNSLHEIHS